MPPSGIVEVEFGFYATHVEGQTILGRLVDGCGSEFVEEHIDDDELTIVTQDTYIHKNEVGSGYTEMIDGTFRVKWILKFPSDEVGTGHTIAPQIRTTTSSFNVRTGKSGSTQYPAMFLSVTSFGNSLPFKTTILT